MLPSSSMDTDRGCRSDVRKYTSASVLVQAREEAPSSSPDKLILRPKIINLLFSVVHACCSTHDVHQQIGCVDRRVVGTDRLFVLPSWKRDAAICHRQRPPFMHGSIQISPERRRRCSLKSQLNRCCTYGTDPTNKAHPRRRDAQKLVSHSSNTRKAELVLALNN
jgi:hypothetical protein